MLLLPVLVNPRLRDERRKALDPPRQDRLSNRLHKHNKIEYLVQLSAGEIWGGDREQYDAML